MTELSGRNRATLASSPLFRGLDGTRLEAALTFFSASVNRYRRGDFLHRTGEPMTAFGLVLDGTVEVCVDDYDGNKMIMADVRRGNTFGESLCFLKLPASPLYIYAAEDATVLWLSPDALFSDQKDPLANELSRRFTSMLARRTLMMNTRIQILSRLRLRDKILAYLGELAAVSHSDTVTVPLNREDWAAYIGSNRSALSRELSAMKQEGVLDFEKNTFRLFGHHENG